jgi:hypothetical protein
LARLRAEFHQAATEAEWGLRPTCGEPPGRPPGRVGGTRNKPRPGADGQSQ